MNSKIILTLFLTPSIALNNFALTATQEGRETPDEKTEEISKKNADASEIFNADNVEKITKAIVVIGTIALIAYMGIEIIKSCKDIYLYFNPTEEKKEAIRKAIEKIAYLDSERNFRECLMKNAKQQLNETGFPVDCEECGHVFAQTAGKEAFNEMVKLFRETYGFE